MCSSCATNSSSQEDVASVIASSELQIKAATCGKCHHDHKKTINIKYQASNKTNINMPQQYLVVCCTCGTHTPVRMKFQVKSYNHVTT